MTFLVMSTATQTNAGITKWVRNHPQTSAAIFTGTILSFSLASGKIKLPPLDKAFSNISTMSEAFSDICTNAKSLAIWSCSFLNMPDGARNTLQSTKALTLFLLKVSIIGSGSIVLFAPTLFRLADYLSQRSQNNSHNQEEFQR